MNQPGSPSEYLVVSRGQGNKDIAAEAIMCSSVMACTSQCVLPHPRRYTRIGPTHGWDLG
jgi:hypothetical protein